VKLNPLRFFKSLSARLLLLTLIWVSFIVTTIGYTMMLNWKLESSSAATNIIGDIRFHVFRTALYVLPQYDNRDFDNEVRTVNAGLDLLQKGDQWRPLLVPETQAIRSSLQSIDSEWKESVLPHLTAARGGAREPMMGDVNLYVEKLAALAAEWHAVPMLAHTHGQPASPTRLGKELMVFVERLDRQIDQLKAVAVTAKFGGATGNFNAHHVAYPAVDWIAFANRFVGNTLGLTRSQYTTQIEHYDNLAALFDALKRIDTILIDLCRDMWTYISMEYFKQRIKAGEIGSSAMPHKVNPIDFENAEGNLGIANALYEHLAGKLPVSRMQRDLTDSTVLRNVGVPVAHTLLAVASLMKGLGKVILNEEALRRDLDDNWAVVAEGIQTVLRRAGYPSPYEALKALTRTNTHITAEAIAAFIAGLDVSEEVKAELRAITPASYTGIDF